MNYQDYEAEDFLMDESFKKWLLTPDPETSRFWEKWLSRHPEKVETVKEARQLFLLLSFKNRPFTPQDSQQVWQAIQAGSAQPKPVQPLHQSWFTQWRRVAAVVAGFLLIGVGYFTWSSFQRTTEYLTSYGETRLIYLPDSSQVTLNANSQLAFSTAWEPARPREVWLKGEAFFHVRKKPAVGQSGRPSGWVKFTVHTDDLDVNVLGTEFNVNERRGKTQVVLTSGKVRLDIKSIENSQPLTMKPGESVVVSAKESRVIKQTVNPKNYSSWTRNQLIFDNTPLSEVAILIEDNYGVPVVFRDPAQAKRRIRGTVPVDDLNILLAALANSFNLSVTREDEKIIIINK